MANASKVDEAGEQEEKDKKVAGCPRGWISSCVLCPQCLHCRQLPETGQGLAGPRLVIPVWSRSIPSQAPLSECLSDTDRAEGKAYAV